MKNFDFNDFMACCLGVIMVSIALLILSDVIRLVILMFFSK